MEKLAKNENRYVLSWSISFVLALTVIILLDNSKTDSTVMWIFFFVIVEIFSIYYWLIQRCWKAQVFFQSDKIIFKNHKDEESEILWVDTVVNFKWKKFYFLNYFYPVTFKSRKDKKISVKILLFLLESKSVKELNEKYVPKEHSFYMEAKKLFP